MLETCFHGGQLFWDGSGGPIPKLGLWVKLSCGSEGGGVIQGHTEASSYQASEAVSASDGPTGSHQFSSQEPGLNPYELVF